MTDVQTLISPEGSSRFFRAVLTALSRPGTPVAAAGIDDAPAPLSPLAAAVSVTLCDYQSPLWLSPKLDKPEARKFLRFHTGAAIALKASESAFAIVTMEEATVGLPEFALGAHEYPDRSTTVVIQTADFSDAQVHLSGPGIKGTVELGVSGASRALWTLLQKNTDAFPLGFDTVFVADAAIVGLPRSTRITIMEQG